MFEVKQFKPGDSVGVRDLILSILKDEYPFDMNAYSETDINDISGVYGGDKNFFFVVKDGMDVVGTIGIKKETGDMALMRRLFVSKKYRRRGLGLLLVRKAIDTCRANGYDKIAFRATDRMKEAMRLLEKNGFKETESLEVGGFHIHNYLLKL